MGASIHTAQKTLPLNSPSTLVQRFSTAWKLHKFLVSKRLQRSQAEQRNREMRKRHIKDLEKKVKEKNWQELVEFGTDKEVQM